MRTKLFFIGCVPFAIAACSMGGKVDESAVDPAKKTTAQDFGTKLWTACTTGKFDSLGDDAIQAMRTGLTPEKQKEACVQTRKSFGEWQSMDYVETWKVQGLYVYRFKGHFSKSTETPEIRVVLDGDGKLAGFWLKPWSSDLK